MYTRPKGSTRFQDISAAELPLPSAELDGEVNGLVNYLNGLGTLTVNISQWAEENGVIAFVSSTSFTVSGDVTGTYTPFRRIKADLSGTPVYSTVESSSYDGGTGLSTVVIRDSVLTASLSTMYFALISPDRITTSLPLEKIVPLGFHTGLAMETASPDTITIFAGLSIDVDGVLCRVTSNQTIDRTNSSHCETPLPTGLFYVYLIPNTSTGELLAGTNIKISLTAPLWNFSKNGWYHPTNTTWRAIGSAYYESGLYYKIVPFTQSGDKVVCDFDGVTLYLQSSGTSTSPVPTAMNGQELAGVMAKQGLVTVTLFGAGSALVVGTSYNGYVYGSGLKGPKAYAAFMAETTLNTINALSINSGWIELNSTTQYVVNSASVKLKAGLYAFKMRL